MPTNTTFAAFSRSSSALHPSKHTAGCNSVMIKAPCLRQSKRLTSCNRTFVHVSRLSHRVQTTTSPRKLRLSWDLGHSRLRLSLLASSLMLAVLPVVVFPGLPG